MICTNKKGLQTHQRQQPESSLDPDGNALMRQKLSIAAMTGTEQEKLIGDLLDSEGCFVKFEAIDEFFTRYDRDELVQFARNHAPECFEELGGMWQ